MEDTFITTSGRLLSQGKLWLEESRFSMTISPLTYMHIHTHTHTQQAIDATGKEVGLSSLFSIDTKARRRRLFGPSMTF